MGMTADRKFDWIAALSVGLGAAVMIPALTALAVNLIAVAAAII